jgi:hypothetical protein
MEAGARAHLDGCETCQANLAEWESSGRLFHGIFDDSSSGPLEDCPTDCPPLENLLRLASSSNPETDAAVLEHVTCCEACGAILRDATLAKELKTASPQWQKKSRAVWPLQPAATALPSGWPSRRQWRLERPECRGGSSPVPRIPKRFWPKHIRRTDRSNIGCPMRATAHRTRGADRVGPRLTNGRNLPVRKTRSAAAWPRILTMQARSLLKGWPSCKEGEYESAIESLTHASELELHTALWLAVYLGRLWRLPRRCPAEGCSKLAPGTPVRYLRA